MSIEHRLAEKAIEPQVIVTITKSVTNAATVSGEVVNGARVPLSVNGDRLLDLIALAGGAKSPVYDTFVRLSRNGATATIPMERLVSDPAENIYAQPGDMLTLVRVPQTYSVLRGDRAKRPADLQCREDNLGGSARQGRRAARSALGSGRAYSFSASSRRLWSPRSDAPQLDTGPDRSSPVVYRLDMSDAHAYFLAQRFPVEDKDIIYVANARLNELQKFFTLLNTMTGPVITGIVVKNAAPCSRFNL